MQKGICNLHVGYSWYIIYKCYLLNVPNPNFITVYYINYLQPDGHRKFKITIMDNNMHLVIIMKLRKK